MEKPHRKRVALVIALLVTVVASGTAAALMTGLQSRKEIEEWTDREAAVVESVVQDVLDDIFADLEAAAAFVEQANPSPEQFATFSAQIGANSNALGFGYITKVSAAEADAHIARKRAEIGDFYDLYGISAETGLTVPVDRSDREFFYAAQMISIGDQMMGLIPDEVPLSEVGLGIDAGFDEAWREHIASGMASPGRSLSPFITLDAGQVRVERTFLAFVPVGSDGVVTALMVEPLLLANLEMRALHDVQWEVIALGGTPQRVDSEHTQLYELDVPDNPWQLVVAPTDDAAAALTSSPWRAGLTAAAVAAIAAAMLWLLVERRTQRARSAQMRVIAEEKDRFLATVSHELRTPLTVVAGFAEEIRDRSSDFDRDELTSILDLIVGETDELTAIVEDLLVAARSDISSVRVVQQPVAVLEEAQNAVETLGIPAVVTGDEISALADSQRVRQILRNLLTNARRYGGKEIRVDVRRAGDANVTVTVSDSGDGISPSKRNVIFQPYQSAHRPGTETGSVGLGLYISRALAEAMGGDLNYRRSGTWSRFSLVLPAADCPLPEHGATLVPMGAPTT